MGISVREEEDLFARAIQLPPGDRGAFLRTACGEDNEMRKRVEELVVAHESGRSLVDRPCEEARAIEAVVRYPRKRSGRPLASSSTAAAPSR